MLGDVTVIGAFFAGLLSFLSPCVLPLVPAYLSFLGGTSLQSMMGKDGKVSIDARLRIILASVFFVLGLATIFISLGAVITSLGSAVANSKGLFLQIGGVFIAIFGLHFLGILRIPFLYRQAKYESTVEPATLIGAYLMGIFFAFGWTPCVGPVLSAILMMAADTATLSKGMTMLTAYTIGLGIPFVLAAVSISFFMSFLDKFKQHLDIVEKIMGAFLVALGLLFVFDQMAMLTDLFPEVTVEEEQSRNFALDLLKVTLYALALGATFIAFTAAIGFVMKKLDSMIGSDGNQLMQKGWLMALIAIGSLCIVGGIYYFLFGDSDPELPIEMFDLVFRSLFLFSLGAAIVWSSLKSLRA